MEPYKEMVYIIMTKQNLILGAVASATFLDTLIFGIIIPILPGYSESLGASPFILGVIFASYSAALLAGTIPLGIISDRYGRKKVMFFGLVTLSISTMGFALANSILLIILTRVLQGFSAAATWTSGPALIAEIVPPEQRGVKMGFLSAANGLGFLIGPAAGGLLFEVGGYQLPFILATCLCIIISIVVLTVIPKDKVKKVESTKKASLLQVLGIRGVLLGSAIILIGSIGFGMIDPLLPGYFTQKFDISPGVIGILFAIISVFHIVSAPVIGKLSDRYGRLVLIKVGTLATAMVIPLISLADSLVTTGVVMGLMGITFGLMLTPTMPLLADSVMNASNDSYDASYGAAFGIYNTAFSLGYLVGPLLGGGWLEFYALPGLLLLYSLLLFICIPFLRPKVYSLSTK